MKVEVLRLPLNAAPVQLVYSEQFHSKREAVQRERQLKHWSRAKKEALVLGDLDQLKQISKRR